MKDLSVVVLAAGKGKRMNNPDTPKVLAKLLDKPLIYYVVNVVFELKPKTIILVVGHKGDLVKEYIQSEGYKDILFANQEQQLGTGHAVLMANNLLDNFDGNTLILAGDIPNITYETLSTFIKAHYENHNDLSVLSANANNPFGYGRIVRNDKNEFLKITEQKDADTNIQKITEINSGIIIVDNRLLFNLLGKVKNNNNQSEYYLTDIIEIAVSENYKVNAIQADNFDELQGINTLEELTKAENYKKLRG